MSGQNEPAGAASEQRPRWTISHSTLLIVFASAVVLVWYSHKPLYHSDLWGHLSYGRWMWEQGQLPSTEPLMPLAENVPMIASAWLTQLTGFLVVEAGGHHGLQFSYGLLIATSFAFVCHAVARQSGAALWSLVAGALFVFVLRWQLVIIRPQLVGLCCFAGLVCLLEAKSFGRRTAARLAILFVVWVNAHPSFPAGLILLTIYAAMRVAEVARLGHKGMFSDSRLRWLIVFGITAGLAVVLNPYGFAAYPETLRVAANPNLQDLRDWQAPDLTSKFAVGYLISMPLVLITALLARQRRWEILTATAFAGGVTFFSKRMLCWYAVLSAVSIGVHAASRFKSELPVRTRRRGLFALLCLAVLVFAASPLWRACVRSQRRPLVEVAAASTPVGATDYLLQDYDGKGLVWTPNTWGDFVTWRSEVKIPVMVNSHAHLVPRDVWLDYRAVSMVRARCLEVLDERRINWVVVDRRRNRLRTALEQSGNWNVVFDDARSAVLRRVRK